MTENLTSTALFRCPNAQLNGTKVYLHMMTQLSLLFSTLSGKRNVKWNG